MEIWIDEGNCRIFKYRFDKLPRLRVITLDPISCNAEEVLRDQWALENWAGVCQSVLPDWGKHGLIATLPDSLIVAQLLLVLAGDVEEFGVFDNQSARWLVTVEVKKGPVILEL